MYISFARLEIPLSNDTPVHQKDFLKKFSHMKDFPAFAWMFTIFKGYENKNLNFGEDNDKNKKRD